MWQAATVAEVFCQYSPRLNQMANFGGLVKASCTLETSCRVICTHKEYKDELKTPPLLLFFFVSGFLLDFLFLNELFLLKFLLIYVKSSEGPLPSHSFLFIKFFVRIFEDIKNKVFLSDFDCFCLYCWLWKDAL